MLQFMDDFTSYGTDANRVNRLTDGVYAGQQYLDLVADPDPTAGGRFVLMLMSNAAGSIIRKVLTSAQTTVGVAARYWLNGIPSTTGMRPTFSSFADVNNVNHISVTCNPSGYIEVYRNDIVGSVLIGQSSSPILVSSAWKHMETKVFFSATVGTVEVRVEGATVLSLTGIRTTSNIVGAIATAQNVTLVNSRDGPFLFIKDFIIWDGSGSVNNNFLGSCQVYKIIPDADVSLNWTPSSGSTGFNLTNETTPSEDVGYISAPTPPPAAAQFSLSDLPATVTSVKGIMTMNRSRKTDGGDGNLQVGLISGASTGLGLDRPITTAYTYWFDVFDQDPSAVPWTKTLVNALKLRLNRTL